MSTICKYWNNLINSRRGTAIQQCSGWCKQHTNIWSHTHTKLISVEKFVSNGFNIVFNVPNGHILMGETNEGYVESSTPPKQKLAMVF